MKRFLLATFCAASLFSCAATEPTVEFTYQNVGGIGSEKGVCRRDPSDVIKVGDKYYVWYTKLPAKQSYGTDTYLYPHGYSGTIWYATSTDEGKTWKEEGMAVGKGEDGKFDSFGVMTPNIIKEGEKYYLYYTVMQNGFTLKEHSRINETTIVMAEADSPDGPWVKNPLPIITPGRGMGRFDSFRIDDACLAKHNGKFYLYFKGRQWGKTPRDTKMGVAIADKPTGPFQKLNNGDYIQNSGHECLIWKYNGEIYSLASNHGPNPRSLWKSKDGVKLEMLVKGLKKLPKAPGLYRPELTDLPVPEKHNKWGIAMKGYAGDPGLIRYEMKINEQD